VDGERLGGDRQETIMILLGVCSRRFARYPAEFSTLSSDSR
jgi:hypothetical protein